jgi:hypothetical protein
MRNASPPKRAKSCSQLKSGRLDLNSVSKNVPLSTLADVTLVATEFSGRRISKLMSEIKGRVALGSYPPRAPTDPYVRALAHTVRRPTGWLSTQKVPEAIQSSCGDMLRNLDVFRVFPSIESADRCLAFLHRVLRGEFPCFNGTIKALRLPAAHLASLRFLRLAIPREHLVAFVSPTATEC